MAVTDLEQPRSLRPFFILWIGQAFSLLGSQMVQFALIWWLTQQTGSATVLALASIVGLLPQVVLGPFVGVLVDRWNRKWTMVIADALVAVATLALVYLFWSGNVEVWSVYVILFIRALGSTFHRPAFTASTSLMVPQEQLTRIQGLNQMLNGGLNIASAPLGALLVTLLPIQNVLLIDLATAAVAIAATVLVRVPQPRREAADAEAPVAAYWSDLRQGLRYVLNWRGLLLLAGIAMLINMVIGPAASFMPLLVIEHFNGTAWHLGILEAAFGIGIVGGGMLLGIWGGFHRRIFTSILGIAGIGAAFLTIGLIPAAYFPLAVLAGLVCGVMSSLADGPIMAIFQATVAPSMQGRVFTLVGSASAAMMPIGLAFAGPLAEAIGVRTLFMIGGLVTLAAAVVCCFLPELLNIEQDRDDFPAPAVEQPVVSKLAQLPE